MSITANACGLNKCTFLHLFLAGQKTFCWTPEMDLAFKQKKSLIAQDCLLAYPNHIKPFHIYTDNSSYQMGAQIFQDNKPVTFWSCKLNDTQLK